MKKCSNPDCETQGALLPDSAFYSYHNKAKGKMCLSSRCRPCEQDRRKKYMGGGNSWVNRKKPATLERDQAWINEVMKIRLVRGQKC